jgi:hypothetical protein
VDLWPGGITRPDVLQFVVMVIFLLATGLFSSPIEAGLASISEPLTGVVLVLVAGVARSHCQAQLGVLPLGLGEEWGVATTGQADHRSRGGHTFLTAREVIARYRWGRTRGNEQLRSGDFPRPVAGRYRLDLLMAWEARGAL